MIKYILLFAAGYYFGYYMKHNEKKLQAWAKKIDKEYKKIKGGKK